MNISLLLTILRLLLSPLLVPFIFFQAAATTSWRHSLLYGLFLALLSLTDFLDGYLARRKKQVTTLGAALDPLADKVFLIAALISLLSLQRIHYFWVLILLLREMLIMGVRAIALESAITIPVSPGGKLKTIVQLTYLICMASIPALYIEHVWCVSIQNVLLLLGTSLSVASAMHYIWKFIEQMQALNKRVGRVI
jgi:CDP-diacylglycerol--glycerol-3-phosphate 3-phosphatidyltransferase